MRKAQQHASMICLFVLPALLPDPHTCIFICKWHPQQSCAQSLLVCGIAQKVTHSSPRLLSHPVKDKQPWYTQGYIMM